MTVEQPRQSESAAIISMIERVAGDARVPIERLEKLLELRERAEARAASMAFDAAMSATQNGMQPIVKDAKSDKGKYASYGALDTAIRPIYTTNGFSLSFNTEPSKHESHVLIVCDVAHIGGCTRRYQIDMPADGKGAKGGDVMTRTHAMGSALSYGQRYLLRLIFNVADRDDDGNVAGRSGELINEGQVKRLEKELPTPASVRMFCQKFGIAALEELPAAKFNDALAAINKRKEEAAKKKAAEEGGAT